MDATSVFGAIYGWGAPGSGQDAAARHNLMAAMRAATPTEIAAAHVSCLTGRHPSDILRDWEDERARTLPKRFADFKERLAIVQKKNARPIPKD